MTKFKPEGALLPTAQNTRALSSAALLREAFYTGAILEGRVMLCDAQHNLHVDLGCMKGIIPKNEGALGIEDGTVALEVDGERVELALGDIRKCTIKPDFSVSGATK